MKKNSSRKNTTNQRRNRKPNMFMQKKLVTLFMIMLLAFVGLSVRLVMINSEKGEDYKMQILSQQSYSSTTLPFRRGDILDANGIKLATSEKVYNLIIDSKNILSDKKYLEPTMKALKQCFPQINESEIRTFIAANPASQYHKVLKQLTYDEISAFTELQANTKENPNIKGVWFEEEYKRVYPNDTLASTVIGFAGKDNNGSFGLEGYYNDVLNGIDGRDYGYMNEDSTLERTTIPATDGYNIVSTIDSNIQSIVERHLYNFNETNKNNFRTGNGAYNVGCIIMNVNNGDILAMADYPNFDLNNNHSTDALIGSLLLDEKGKVTEEKTVITEENVDEVLSNEDILYQNLNGLWKNFCISDTYEPGSTAKPFTVACGLESGKMTGEELYTCKGSLQVANYDIKCHNYKIGGDGTVTVQQAVEKSCNVALMLMGKQIGEDTFLDFQNIFNFGLKTNVDLDGEARTELLVFDEKTMGETELATSTFGQGYNVTMIQMISAFSSLVNGGYYYEPHMVKKITASDGSVVKNINPRIIKQTVSSQTSEKIIQYCNGVVTDGTGKTARPAGYAIGGKTGTAEMAGRNKEDYLLSFMGYAPADNPQIAIYVVVDRPNTQFQDDAKFATRIVRGVLTEVLPYLNIYMTEELSDKERQELEELDILIKQQIIQSGSVSDNEVSEEETTETETEQTTEEAPVDANGGDTTSSTPVSEEEKQRDDVVTAPETGALIDPVTGEPVRKE